MNTSTVLRAFEQTVVDGLYLRAQVNTVRTFAGEEARKEQEAIGLPMYNRRKRQYGKFKAWLEGRSYMARLAANMRVGEALPGLVRVTYGGEDIDDPHRTPLWLFRRDYMATKIIEAIEKSGLTADQWRHPDRTVADPWASLALVVADAMDGKGLRWDV